MIIFINFGIENNMECHQLDSDTKININMSLL